jgi:hypothetical protein
VSVPTRLPSLLPSPTGPHPDAHTAPIILWLQVRACTASARVPIVGQSGKPSDVQLTCVAVTLRPPRLPLGLRQLPCAAAGRPRLLQPVWHLLPERPLCALQGLPAAPKPRQMEPAVRWVGLGRVCSLLNLCPAAANAHTLCRCCCMLQACCLLTSPSAPASAGQVRQALHGGHGLLSGAAPSKLSLARRGCRRWD